MANDQFQCSNCNWWCSISEMDYDEHKKTMNCPNCGFIIISNYKEKADGRKSN